MLPSTNHRRHSWRLEDIAFDAVDTASMRNDEFLFLTLASASFVEILAETYSDNLVQHFRGDVVLTNWLSECWQREEVLHGHALKRYVQTTWPDFDWEHAYRAFLTQYSVLCTVEKLEPHKALELLARCVVETGTSSFYRALQHYAQEPVLRQLIGKIKADEASHYLHFRRHFIAYNALERHGVGAAIATIWRRLRNVRGEDAYIAFKHVHAGRYPNRPFFESDWHHYNQTVKRLARRHYPYLMAVKMLIKPIPMFEPIKKLLQWPLVGLAMLISIG